MASIILIDDEVAVTTTLRLFLAEKGYTVTVYNSPRQALQAIVQAPVEPDVILTDVRMPEMTGTELLQRIREEGLQSEVIVVTAFAQDDHALRAMELGAYDYITKPYRLEEVQFLIRRALEKRRIRAEIQLLRDPSPELLFRSEAMQDVLAVVKRVATVNSPVLITGESGVGKEVIAREIWRRSLRATAPFIPINCGAIPEALMESELFGHVRGAFTGADIDKVGLFASADKGTLLLDEVGELPLPMQVKLLRVLQDHRIRPVGGTAETSADIRFILATNRDLREAIRAGRFREDLLYRINVVEITIPPLRKRRDDIVPLAEHFALRVASRYGIAFAFSDAHREYLLRHDFPGNVRELQNWVERTVILGELDPSRDRPHTFVTNGTSHELMDLLYDQIVLGILPYEEAVRQIERQWLERAYTECKGIQTDAAAHLHLSLRQFRYRFEQRFGRAD